MTSPPKLPLWARPFSLLLPEAEKGEVLRDLEEEFQLRCAENRGAANRWLFNQLRTSALPLVGRSVWRGNTGFEPGSSRFQPGGLRMERWIIDTRYALRHLRHRPLYASLWTATLALGIGGTVAVFALLSTFVLNPLPYEDESSLYGFWAPFDWAEAEHVALRPDYPGFDIVATYRQEPVALRQGEAPARMLHGIASSVELFDVLGVAPLIGRTFLPGEDVHQGPPTVLILSHRLWQQLGGSREIIGNQLEVDGTNLEIVGVMPKGFFFPEPKVDLWMNAALDPENRSGNYALVGRSGEHRGDRSEGAASAEQMDIFASQIGSRLAERFEYPEQWDKTKNAFVVPLREELLGSAKLPLLATQIAMIAILLMAAGNVAALMLGQLGTRQGELRLRYALGAPRARLARQFAIESMILGTVAGLVGGGCSLLFYRVLVSTMPLGVFTETLGAEATIDLGAVSAPTSLFLLATALGLAIAISLAIAIVPAVAVWRRSAEKALSGVGRGNIGGRGGRTESALVISEIAVASLLVAVAGLLLQSASNLGDVDVGLDPEHVAAVMINAPSGLTYADRLNMIERIQDELRALPGVEAVSSVQRPPLSGGGWSTGFSIENVEEHEGSTTYYRMVTEDYFDVMGLDIEAGRGFLSTDGGQASEGDQGQDQGQGESQSRAVTVINRALADKFFAGEDPLGKRISHGMRDDWTTVVGVVENEAVGNLTDPMSPTRYILYRDVGFTPQGLTFVLRTDPQAKVEATLPLIRPTLERVAPELAIERVAAMREIQRESMGVIPQLTQLLTLLGALALILGAIGIYGVINHFVGQRKREWSLRLALGLRPREVLQHVVARGAVLIALGLAVGLLATRSASRLFSSFLYGTEPLDVGVLSISALVLVLSGLLAALIPAWKAGRTDPATLLRD